MNPHDPVCQFPPPPPRPSFPDRVIVTRTIRRPNGDLFAAGVTWDRVNLGMSTGEITEHLASGALVAVPPNDPPRRIGAPPRGGWRRG